MFHLINRTHTPLLHDKSPYQMVYNEIPHLSHMKIFGCLAFATTTSVQRTKLSSRARKCVFLGYKDRVKGFNLFYMNRKNIFVRHDKNNLKPYFDTTLCELILGLHIL